jgi:alkaline phosphatase D
MVLSTAMLYENYINTFGAERQYILDAIQRERITGVFFLTGDRHHTELSKLQPEGGVQVFDLTVSPLTSGAYPGDGDQNQCLVKGTEVTSANYALLEVTGPRQDRKLSIQVKDVQGKELWKQEFLAKEVGK